MRTRHGIGLIALAGLVLALAIRVAAQAGTAPPPAQTGRGGRGGARGGSESFPAQQRPPADPALVERGRAVFAVSCGACHGADARGGQLGGPNLLRSQLVLTDQDGEVVGPIVRNGRPGTPMVPIAMTDEDLQAVTAFLHTLLASGRGQGSPPPGPAVTLNVIVGDARAGASFFSSKCSRCHSAAGDLRGIATRLPDAKALQNAWVSGNGGRGGRGATTEARTVTVTVTLPTKEKVTGRLVRLDDFSVALADADGTIRSFAREGDRPKLEINDPMEGHRALLQQIKTSDMHNVTAYLVTLK